MTSDCSGLSPVSSEGTRVRPVLPVRVPLLESSRGQRVRPARRVARGQHGGEGAPGVQVRECCCIGPTECTGWCRVVDLQHHSGRGIRGRARGERHEIGGGVEQTRTNGGVARQSVEQLLGAARKGVPGAPLRAGGTT